MEGLPTHTEVFCPVDIRTEVACPVVIERRVGGSGGREGRCNAADVSTVTNALDVSGNFAPGRAEVLADLEIAVVEADPEYRRIDRGLIECDRFTPTAGTVVS